MLLCALFLPGTAHAVTVPVDEDRLYTIMDHNETAQEKDPGNASLPYPIDNTVTSSGNRAFARLRATDDEAGVAKAVVGLNIDWDTGAQTFEQISDVPVEVRVVFRYNLQADWTSRTGSANAGVSITPIGKGWFDFLGFETRESGSRNKLAAVSIHTTPGQIGNRIDFNAYAQAHTRAGHGVQNNSSAEITVHSIEFRWRPPTPDLEATGLEVTQAVQDLNNSVRLVAGKRTFVRFHVRSNTSSTFRSYARLRVESADELHWLNPVNPGRHIFVRPNPNRQALQHSFLYELPSSVTMSGTVTITAELNPTVGWKLTPRDPEESTYDNNTQQVTVRFETVPPLHLVVYRVAYGPAANPWRTARSHLFNLVRWLQAAYPVAVVNVRDRTFTYTSGLPDCRTINDILESKRSWDQFYDFIGEGANIAAGARYYALVDDRGYEVTPNTPGSNEDLWVFMRGCSPIPGHAASGPAGVPRVTAEGYDVASGWDTDGSYGDWYGGHELGHSYGRRHPGHCRDQTRDTDLPADAGDYENGDISPAATGPTAQWGFNIHNQAIYPPTWKDVMTYCNNQWISDHTYEALMDVFQTAPVAATQKDGYPAAENSHGRLFVSGMIDPAAATALNPAFLLTDGSRFTEPTPGPYEIVLRDSGGNELAAYPFTPAEIEPGPPAPGLQHTADKTTLLINETVPHVDGTAQLDVRSQTATLATIKPGADPPTVTVTAPNGGETLNGENVQISWTAGDANGDALRFNVQYSPDNGSSWEMLAQNVEGTTLPISRSNFIAGDQALVRVWASDGLNTARDQSDGTFTVANHVPEVTLLSPISGTTYAISDTISFQADALDADVGLMAGEQMTWTSDIDGLLGSGNPLALATLTFGMHTISLRADDGHGGVVTKTTKITVTLSPALLPAVADVLLAGPPAVALDPSQGMTRTLLYADNANTAGTIGWDAAADKPWIQLSKTTGPTPGEIILTYDSTGLATGVYTGTITFSSPDVPETIPVQVILTWSDNGSGDGHSMYLPAVLKE